MKKYIAFIIAFLFYVPLYLWGKWTNSARYTMTHHDPEGKTL